MKNENKRLFFGLQIAAPWPEDFPKGRLLDQAHRHMTVAFLGNVSFDSLQEGLTRFPLVSPRIGLVGHFNACIALPPAHPRVVAWHAVWLDESSGLIHFQKELVGWLKNLDYQVDAREWLPHVTLCRQPFDLVSWMKAFVPIPFYTGAIHLFESVGNLIYTPIWTCPIRAPFEEIEHTADRAFIVRGETLLQLYHHAFTALAFKCPALLDFFCPLQSQGTLDDIIIELNGIIGRADGSIGCPMKAVSYHGEVVELEDSTLEWEMIVDV